MIIPDADSEAREGWEEQLRLEVADDENLMGDISNSFDDSDWIWEGKY